MYKEVQILFLEIYILKRWVDIVKYDYYLSNFVGVQHSTLMSQVTAVEALNLKISVLAATAYICLCLGDYVVALEHAKSLLNINKLPGAYRMLGNLYAAESLIFMDKISEAIEYLKPENIQDLNTFVFIPEPQDKDKEKIDEVISKPIKSEK